MKTTNQSASLLASSGLEFGRKDANGQGNETGDKPVTDQIKELSEALVTISSDVKNFGEDVKKKMTTGQTLTEELKAKADEALAKQGEVMNRLDELEQKAARDRDSGTPAAKTAGELFIADEGVKAAMAKGTSFKGRVDIDIDRKALSGLTAGAGGALVETDRQPGLIAAPDRRMTIRDLLTPGNTGSNSIEYVKETGFTNNAGMVSETVQKPESAITFALATANVATIAHWVHASRQILADASMLRSYIDGRLRYGLQYKEESQLLNGDGTGINLNGINTQATAYSAPLTLSGATSIDMLRLAHLQAELAEYPSTGQVLHPSDWARIELTKDAESRYIFANPMSMATPVMWGRPVVTTQAMTQDDFLVGAFRLGAQIFDREQINVAASTEDRDNFIKNMVTILAEERLALAVFRPEAFITGDFGLISG